MAVSGASSTSSSRGSSSSSSSSRGSSSGGPSSRGGASSNASSRTPSSSSSRSPSTPQNSVQRGEAARAADAAARSAASRTPSGGPQSEGARNAQAAAAASRNRSPSGQSEAARDATAAANATRNANASRSRSPSGQSEAARDTAAAANAARAHAARSQPSGIQSEAARDAAAAARVARNSVTNSSRGPQSEAARDAAANAMSPPPKPIQVRRDTVVNPDGSRVTTVNIDVRAAVTVYSQSNGSNINPAVEAARVEKSIERNFTRSYAAGERNITHYVTTVHMVNQTTAPDRIRFDYIDSRTSILGNGRFSGIAAPTTNTAYISHRAPPTTAAHEFGHLAGLFHTVTTNGNSAAGNLMDKLNTVSEHIDRSQLDTIANNPAFR